jgi:SAM-dependent methyltransferase
MSAATVWHEVECGGYAADLELWDRLARQAAGRVLELGSGAGRVSLHLARRGRAVWGLDRDARLIEALLESASREALVVNVVSADARTMALGASFKLIIAPMQFMQMLGGSEGRIQALERASFHLAPSGRLAAAIVEHPAAAVEGPTEGLPDVRERDGWVFSSVPTVVPTGEGGLEIRRLRQAVSPAGALSTEEHTDHLESLDAQALEAEAATAGLALQERCEVAAADGYLGSTVLVFGRA